MSFSLCALSINCTIYYCVIELEFYVSESLLHSSQATTTTTHTISNNLVYIKSKQQELYIVKTYCVGHNQMLGTAGSTQTINSNVAQFSKYTVNNNNYDGVANICLRNIYRHCLCIAILCITTLTHLVKGSHWLVKLPLVHAPLQ